MNTSAKYQANWTEFVQELSGQDFVDRPTAKQADSSIPHTFPPPPPTHTHKLRLRGYN